MDDKENISRAFTHGCLCLLLIQGYRKLFYEELRKRNDLNQQKNNAFLMAVWYSSGNVVFVFSLGRGQATSLIQLFKLGSGTLHKKTINLAGFCPTVAKYA